MSDWILDHLGWAGNAVLIAALVLAGRKWRHAFLLTALGEAVWCVAAWRIGRADMLFICATFCVLALWNWRLWNREGGEER